MKPRRATVLLVVLIMSSMAAMVAVTLMFRMRAEVSAAASCDRSEQAYQAAQSGLQRVYAVLKTSLSDPNTWTDNPMIFKNQLIYDDGVNQWYFTIYADNPSDRTVTRAGVEDEASKININVATPDTLLAMPNMTSDLVDCLIDYRDADSTPRPAGAEQDYYDGLPMPYLCKNGPLFTLEELLMVKGFTAEIVFGEDANLNGMLDQNEDDGDVTFPPDNSDGVLDTGLRGVATVYSYELPVDSNNKARVLLNGDPNISKVGLPKQTVNFITRYLGEGNKFTHPSQLLEMTYTPKKPASAPAGGGDGNSISSGVTAKELPLVMDRLTVSPTVTFGLVNVNTAPLNVLSILPGFDETLAQKIIDARTQLDPSVRNNVAWLFTEGVVDAATFKKIAPLLTARSFQFNIRCVGFGLPCGRFRSMQAVVDFARGGTPRILYQRDITRLGQPFVFDANDQEIQQ